MPADKQTATSTSPPETDTMAGSELDLLETETRLSLDFNPASMREAFRWEMEEGKHVAQHLNDDKVHS